MIDIQLPTVIVGAAVVCFVACFIDAHRDHKLWRAPPDTIAWAGLRNEWFPKFRASIRDWKDGIGLLKDGYEEPDDVLSNKVVIDHLMSLRYVAPTKATYQNRYHEEVLRWDVSRHLGDLTGGLSEELIAGLGDTWGTNTETYKEICVYKTVQGVVLRAFTRAFVGRELAEKPHYLRAVKTWAHCFAASSNAIAVLVPRFLQPAIAPLLALPTSLALRRVNAYLIPLIKTRIISIREELSNDPDLSQNSETRDLLYWLIRHALMHEPHSELDPSNLAGRLSFVNFAALHTSSLTFTNVMFNICSGPDAATWIEALRDEATTVLAAHDGRWSRAAIANLFKADSAIKETLRYTGIAGRGLNRQVVKADGLTLPDGTQLPKGVRVCVPIGPIHVDEKLYESPEIFQPFRFADMRRLPGKQVVDDIDELDIGHGPPKEKADSARKRTGLGLVTPSEIFLPFGLGKHACPGRWFAAHELKLLLATIVLNYDIELLDERPINKPISDMTVPPLEETLKVRRCKMD
ncbi:MAG: hypothetical protein M1821_005262 [Bathelium mastoideum]|nr:MAG: hypothetical protein M1821_005262 [Bathelium mastoideum]